MEGIDFIQDLAILMLFAGAFGWIAKRCGLSAVVGYLLAGIVIGPHTPPFTYVTDTNRIQTISELGLVFVMFGIGMGLSIRRLQRMGIAALLCTAIAAAINCYGSQMLGHWLGMNPNQSLFLAGMLMVSSSAIISKVLAEQDAVHQRPGQMALGVTVLEDVVAVVMLTLLGSIARAGSASIEAIGQTIGTLALFVLLLAFTSLLFVPKLMDRLNRAGSPEVQTTITVGLVLGLAWLGVKAGYSSALGAFLLGAIVSETPQKPQVERMFEGIREMFSAMFFVAIGMMIQVQYFTEIWGQILIISAVVLVGRTLAATVAFVVTGHPLRDAVRAGMSLTVIGEFSFIIAQMGISAGVLDESFYPLAAGVALVTAFTAPFMVRFGGPVARFIERLQPGFLKQLLNLYEDALESFGAMQNRNLLWKLSRKRIIQVLGTAAIVTAIFFYSTTFYDFLRKEFGVDFLFPSGLPILYWSVLGALMLAPILAIWRNLRAMSLLYVEALTRKPASDTMQGRLLNMIFQTLAGCAIVLWLWGVLPINPAAYSILLLCLLGVVVLSVIFGKRLVKMQSRVEIALHDALAAAPSPTPGAPEVTWLHTHEEWDVNIGECNLPDRAKCAGQTIGELALRTRFKVSIVGIDRQGFILANPGPELRLYPLDRLLVLGDPADVKKAEAELTQVSHAEASAIDFDEMGMEIVPCEPGSPRLGPTLAELEIPAKTGVQLAGIRRASKTYLPPSGTEVLQPGDELLVLGSNQQIIEFTRWMAPPIEAPPLEPTRDS